MIGRFAAAIVHQHRTAKEPGDNHRRERREQEREVRRGEDVDDVRAPQLAREQRVIHELCKKGAKVLDAHRTAQPSRTWWIDRHEPRVDVAIVLPRIEQPARLHRLSPENIERWRDNRDREPWCVELDRHVRQCGLQAVRPRRFHVLSSRRARLAMSNRHTQNPIGVNVAEVSAAIDCSEGRHDPSS